MKILILGDTHGDWGHLNITLARALQAHPDITHVIQCGDFGYGWDDKPHKLTRAYLTDEQIAYYKENVKFYWLDGNHENFDRLDIDGGSLQPDWKYMSRGSVLEIEQYRLLFCGGATSADKEARHPHISWWPQEDITYGQIRKTFETVDGPIDAIFSHDHPASIPYCYERYNSIVGHGNRSLLNELREHYQPRFWFFGHHHLGAKGEQGGMEWTCCPIIEDRSYTIWDGETITTNW
jgi:predicted phosphodiesterase